MDGYSQKEMNEAFIMAIVLIGQSLPHETKDRIRKNFPDIHDGIRHELSILDGPLGKVSDRSVDLLAKLIAPLDE